jgi:hypothetical protein
VIREANVSKFVKVVNELPKSLENEPFLRLGFAVGVLKKP